MAEQRQTCAQRCDYTGKSKKRVIDFVKVAYNSIDPLRTGVMIDEEYPHSRINDPQPWPSTVLFIRSICLEEPHHFKLNNQFSVSIDFMVC